MHFKTLKEKCEYFRGLADYRLLPNNYVIVMLDGHTFSRMVKKKYKLPFDANFMKYMDLTAKYILENVQGAKLAYVQSDEISILLTDFDTPVTDSYFGYRLCKLQSIIPSMAAAKFNQLVVLGEIHDRSYDNCLFDSADTIYRISDAEELIKNYKPVDFDCKAWSVPSYQEAFNWFLYRQHDCVKNSKQQTAQTYLPHKALLNLTTDEQIEKLIVEKNIDWAQYSDGEKYGRIIYKEPKEETKEINGEMVTYERNTWTVHGATPFDSEDNIIRTLIPQR